MCALRGEITQLGDPAKRWIHGDCQPEDAKPTALSAGMTQGEALRALDQRVTELREFTGPAFQQLQQLIIQTALGCATCLTEERTGTRPGHNIANTIIDGTAYCNEHLDTANGRLVPRKSSGLIVTGG